jgi:hypothetical protein
VRDQLVDEVLAHERIRCLAVSFSMISRGADGANAPFRLSVAY